MQYITTWTMTYEADSPMNAALRAFGEIKDPYGVATVFEVTDENEVTVAIDALEKQIITPPYIK